MHLNVSKRLNRFLVVATAFFVLSACGQGDGPKKVAGTPVPPSIGVLIDSPVSGVAWATSGGARGTTNASGEFEYFTSETVTFSIGGLELGTVTGAPIVTVVELTGSPDPTTTSATNLLVLLQSLDDDSDPTNGIMISASTASNLSAGALDFTSTDFAAQFAGLLTTIFGPDKVVVSATDALNHFYTTYVQRNGTDTFNFAFPGYPAVGGGAEKFVLVFADEFETGTTPSADNWTIETGYGPSNDGWGNNEWQLYTADEKNVRVEDGNLVLTALCPVEPCGVRDGTVTSGKVNTLNKFNFKFGKVVARIKPPVGKGAWPAFWALGANFPDVGWPHSGEIDFMEMHNAFSNDRTTHSTLHWCEDSRQAPATCTFPTGWIFDTQNRMFANSLGDAFHVWEADWNEDRILVSIDGVPYFEREIDAVNMDEFLKEFYLILNVAMGGTLGSNSQPPDGTETFPQTMLVDYVRVFQKEGGSSSGTLSIDFEDAADSYDLVSFGGGAAAVIDNPDVGAINTSTQVLQLKKFAGDIFAGSSVTLPAPLNLEAGRKFTMKVWASRAVPVLFKLEGSSLPEVSVDHSGSGWEELTFDFREISGTFDTITLIFDLGVVGDAAGTPADWTFYVDDINLSAPNFDVRAPELTSVSIASSNDNPALATTDDVVTVTFTADEPLLPPVVMILGEAATVTGEDEIWQASRTVTANDADGRVTFSIAYADLADNAGNGVTRVTDNSQVFVDATAPTVTITGVPETITFATFGPFDLTIGFNEAVSGFVLDDIDVSNGDASDFVRVNDTTYTAIVTPDGDGQLTVNVLAGAAADAAGNLSTMATEATAFVDTVIPTVSIDSARADFDTLEAIGLNIIFSEAVSNFTLDDLDVSFGSPISLITMDNVTYIAQVKPNGNGDLTVTVAQGAFSDAAGNVNVVGAEITIINAIDADIPRMTAISITSNNDTTPGDTTTPGFAKTGNIVTIVMTANEEIVIPIVTILDEPAATEFVSGTTWKATRTLLSTDAPGDVTFTIDFEDLGGLAGFQSTITTDDTSVIFDPVAPTLLSINNLPDPITSLETRTVTFQFSEDVLDFTLDDIVVTNGMADDFMALADADKYTAAITPDGVGDPTITVRIDAVTDFAGNKSEEFSITVAADIEPFWQLVWSDDFDGSALNGTNWTARDDGDCPVPCNNGVQSYNAGNVSVADGKLTIEAQESISGPSYVSGLIDTNGNHALKYGRIEIDAKMPGTLGTAPSLWLLPVSDTYGPWPQSGEIDIANAPDLSVGGNVTLEQALRYGLPVPEDTITGGEYDVPGDSPDAVFYTYALEWEAGEMRWFVDGVHVLTQTQDNWYAYGEDADGVYTLGTADAPFNEEFYLLLGLAVNNTANGTSMFPQSLQIDAVRVFRCAFPVDPAAGTGCGTSDSLPPVDAPNAPYTELLDVYTDATGVLSLLDPNDNTMQTTNNLAAGTSEFVTSDLAFDDAGETVWRVAIDTAGEVFIGSQDFSTDPVLDTGINLTAAAEAAGELIFDMRVISADTNTMLTAKMDSGPGNAGTKAIASPDDTQWHTYSVKIAELLENQTGSGLVLENVVNLFALEASGPVELHLDNIRVIVACRDTGACRPTSRVKNFSYVQEYTQDFEAMIPDQGAATPNDLSNDNWVVGANVFGPNGDYLRFYFGGGAPNGGPGFSGITTMQGGDSQGINQLSVYNDYGNNPDHDLGNRIEAILYRERPITAADIGKSIVFSFDSKRGNINDPDDPKCSPNPCISTAAAFIKVLDPGNSFSLTTIESVNMTDVPPDWGRYSVSIYIPDESFIGQLLQFGLQSVASNYEPSGVFYDNLDISIGTVEAP